MNHEFHATTILQRPNIFPITRFSLKKIFAQCKHIASGKKLKKYRAFQLASRGYLRQNGRPDEDSTRIGKFISLEFRGNVMHIISRRVEESLMIGDDISVTVLEICEDHVRLGITRLSDVPDYWEQTLYLASNEAVQELQLQ
jgi:hypothetical protein